MVNNKVKAVKYPKVINENLFIYVPRLNVSNVGFKAERYGNGSAQGSDQIWNTQDPAQYLEIGSHVTRSCVPNYKGCRIPIHSDLNLSYWNEVLKDYEDTDLIQLLTLQIPTRYK